MKRLDDIKYKYNSLSVPGGGFVTGFLFHPREKDILYARTDIGGVYRYDFPSGRWICLADRITEFKRYLAQPLSIAVDENNADTLFMMCGNGRYGFDGGTSALLVSDSRGDDFIEKPVPFCCNGNAPARSSAERLAYKNGYLFFGTQGEGLWCSADKGDSWERLSLCENNIVFVYFPKSSNIMVVSVSGETLSEGDNRGHTLYVSYDMGMSFERLPIPEPLCDSRCSHNGFVPVGIACRNEDVYITFTHSHKANPWGGWNDFACDNGGGFDGRLYRYKLSEGRLDFHSDITPVPKGFSDSNPLRRLPFGLGGIDAYDNVIAVCSAGGLFISEDSGECYESICSTDLNRFEIDVPYLKPQYNGGRVPLHWMSCLRFDPHSHSFALINTGTGVFALKKSAENVWKISTFCRGIEETVHMNIYGIPSGKNRVIDLVGDLGGFVFSDLDSPCENSFADENGNRYITCLNADFVQDNPDIFIAAARGNWTGETKGGIILTCDGGNSFTHIGYPVGISHKLDEACEQQKKPNTNSGWAAITADGSAILWTVACNYMQLPCYGAVRYDVNSKAFAKVRIFDINGSDISQSEQHIKFFSDRKNCEKAYGFGENGQLYISTDKGESFHQLPITGGFPQCTMSGIDGRKGVEIRFLPHCEGICYAALAEYGLWKLKFSESEISAELISQQGDFVKTVGFGLGDSIDNPALYISGTIFGEYGFWCSYDSGKSWARINTDMQMFGGIVSMDGDLRKKGRVYIATGTRGGLYGDSIC